MQNAKLWFEIKLYFHVFLLAALLFTLSFAYLSWQGLPNVLNKTVTDVSTLLISASLMMSGMAYFFDFLDRKVIYRKHLGLVGFAFGFWHFLLSFSGFEQLRSNSMLAGFIALLIFAMMALISNQLATRLLGGKLWRICLRFGFLALFLVVMHVWLLRAHRWWNWLNSGMSSSVSLALLVTMIASGVLLLRLALEISKRKRKKSQK
jgi:DMSO/TMAO reductase YedYZ heme-binding membrane subunit